ncbi:MAG TPA: phosphotransferase family protein [Acidimicrobiia bacterium]
MSDVIPVRDDERFDVTNYQNWAESNPALPTGKPDVRQFSNGRANLTYLLTYPDGVELVLRRPPLGPVATGSHDMSREYRVLSQLWTSYPLAPRAIAYCGEESVIGADFFVMERRSGIVVKNRVPELFGGGRDVDANRALSTVVIDTLADLHAVDPAECGLDDLGHPDGFMERQVTGWADRWERSRAGPNPIADEVGIWLGENLPESGPPTLIHNDWRLDNMAVSPDDPGRAVAVYDWDMATRGDPLADLGTLLATWYEPGEAPSTLNPMPTDAEGWLRRPEAIARYASQTGRDLAQIEWYVIFGTWKLAVVLQQIYIRWVRGQTQDDRFQILGSGAERLFELAAERRL